MSKLSSLFKVYILGIALLFTTPAQAVPVVIDFDGLSNGDTVGATFSGLGVTFVNATVRSSVLAGVSAPNAIVHSSLISLPTQTNPIEAIFDSVVSSVSLTGIDVGGNGGFIFKAFDAASGGNLVDSAQITGNTPAGVGEFFTLTLANALIRRVEFSLLVAQVGDGLQFDDFTFENDVVSAVPIPAALPLFAGGLGLMGIIGWRRKRNISESGFFNQKQIF